MLDLTKAAYPQKIYKIIEAILHSDHEDPTE